MVTGCLLHSSWQKTFPIPCCVLYAKWGPRHKKKRQWGPCHLKVAKCFKLPNATVHFPLNDINLICFFSRILILFFFRLETKISLADPKTQNQLVLMPNFLVSNQWASNSSIGDSQSPGAWAGSDGCTAAHGRHKPWNILRLGLTVWGRCRSLR